MPHVRRSSRTLALSWPLPHLRHPSPRRLIPPSRMPPPQVHHRRLRLVASPLLSALTEAGPLLLSLALPLSPSLHLDPFVSSSDRPSIFSRLAPRPLICSGDSPSWWIWCSGCTHVSVRFAYLLKIQSPLLCLRKVLLDLDYGESLEAPGHDQCLS